MKRKPWKRNALRIRILSPANFYIIYFLGSLYVSVAQLGRAQIVAYIHGKDEVEGSSPSRGLQNLYKLNKLAIAMDLRVEYEKLNKKYDLPGYNELDEEFELLYFQPVIEIKYPLRFIRRRIVDKFSGFVNYFQNIINPVNASIIFMEESGFLTDEEKKELAIFIKNMIILERESLILDIELDERRDAKFIKEASLKWKEYKLKLLEYAFKIKKEWEKGTTSEEENHYFG